MRNWQKEKTFVSPYATRTNIAVVYQMSVRFNDRESGTDGGIAHVELVVVFYAICIFLEY